MERVRTRFAPSPTGYLHLGGIRTALYNYLVAKKYGGDFILRIEDTDSTRYVEGAQEYIIESLKWLGITPNEGVGFGDGQYGPYIQSERFEIYRKYAKELIDKGCAYYAFDTDEELEQMHNNLKDANVKNAQYNCETRQFMKNSLTMSPEVVEKKIQNGEKYVVRFKVDGSEVIRFKDKIRGWVKVDASTLDDKILIKSDGIATYHLASIVDDHLMKISHVIRGEEWLPSAPLHVMIYKAFGWGNDMPEFVHLPLLLKPNGNGKLSKRDSDEGGFPIFPLSYNDQKLNKKVVGFKDIGYLPEAIINSLVLLGWNPGNNNELIDFNDLPNIFSLEKLQKSGAKFNIKKFEWFNHNYIKKSNNSDLYVYLKEFSNQDQQKLNKICDLAKERSYFTSDLYKYAKMFFETPNTYNPESLESDVIKRSINWIDDFLVLIKDKTFDFDTLHTILINKLTHDNLSLADIMPTFRLILFGKIHGPDVIKSLIILGLNETLNRISKFKSKFNI